MDILIDKGYTCIWRETNSVKEYTKQLPSGILRKLPSGILRNCQVVMEYTDGYTKELPSGILIDKEIYQMDILIGKRYMLFDKLIPMDILNNMPMEQPIDIPMDIQIAERDIPIAETDIPITERDILIAKGIHQWLKEIYSIYCLIK